MNPHVKLDSARLRYFVIVAQELSFSRAAARLHMSQPPLSYQIKQLEVELGVLLFERTGRGVRLTNAGRALFDEARRILMQLEQTARMVERIGGGEVGRLNLGFVPSASNEVLPLVIHHFRSAYPDIELFLQEMNPDDVVQRLHNMQVDAGFFYLPFEDAALDFRPVSREMLVVALPEIHPLAIQAEIELAELAREPFILPMRYQMPGLHAKVLAACQQAGFAPQPVQKDVWLMQTIIGLVAAGLGVALVPASLRAFSRQGVVYRQVRGLTETVEMAIVWRRGDPTKALQSFLRVTQNVCVEQPIIE